jgi:putative spermidine/putrescine transport system permease protein
VFSSVLQVGGRMLDRMASAKGEGGGGQGQRAGMGRKRIVLGMLAVTILLFLSVPALFLIPMSLTQDAYLNWPPRGVSAKWYLEVLQQERWRHAILRSTLVGLSAAVVAVVLGIPAALAVERGRGALRKVLFAIFLTPMIVPHIIIAVGSYYFFARLDLLGTSLALTLGHTVVCIPYVIIVMTAVLQTYDRRLDYAAWSLGANKVRAFRHVMLPIIGSGVAAAFIFAFVTSFDELTIAMFLLAGETTTVPKELWDSAILSVRPAVAAVSVLVLSFVSLLLLIAEYLRRGEADTV